MISLTMADERFFCTAPRNAGDLLVREIAEHGGIVPDELKS